MVLRQKLSRGRVAVRLANLSPCLIGMEACVGAHYLSRQLLGLGQQTVELFHLGPDLGGDRVSLVVGLALGRIEVRELVEDPLDLGIGVRLQGIDLEGDEERNGCRGTDRGDRILLPDLLGDHLRRTEQVGIGHCAEVRQRIVEQADDDSSLSRE